MHTNTPITLESKPVLAWEAPKHPTVQRTKRWYTVAAAVVFLAAAYGIFTGSWSFAIVCVLAGGMYALIGDHAPSTIRIELHDSGVVLDGVFTRWDQLHGYWIVSTPAYDELHFLRKDRRGRMFIQTGAQDAAQLRMVLGQRIAELTHKKEGILDIIIRLCKL